MGRYSTPEVDDAQVGKAEFCAKRTEAAQKAASNQITG